MTPPSPEVAEIARKLTKAETACLMALGHWEDFYRSFKHIAQNAVGIDVDLVPAATRRLRDLGLAKFARGLQTEDGEMYGSGYALTDLGLAVRARLEGESNNG